jgi:trehalose/maltose hydrolase-like predicted phosphorylase
VTDDDAWRLHLAGLDPLGEGHREALCTLGNGIFGTRGSAAEAAADRVHYPGTYAAGLFNRLTSEVGGREVEHESMVNLPAWVGLTLRTGSGPWLDLGVVEVLDHDQVLGVRAGVLHRRFRFCDAAGRTTAVEERRIVSMASPHLGALEWVITAEDWSGPVTVRSTLDGGVENRNVADERALAGRHLRVVGCEAVDDDTVLLVAETTQSHRRVAEAARTRAPGVVVGRSTWTDADRIGQDLHLELEQGRPVTVEKVVGLFTSLDPAISEPGLAATAEVAAAPSFDVLLRDHRRAWDHLWRRGHFALGGRDTRVARALNLHVFHVLQTLSPHLVDRDVGVPARGLHGEGYRGHIFWDDLFVFPFLNLRFPGLTRELLLYRYRRLPAARRAAAAEGRRGALYPWQSGSDGREETPTALFNPRSDRWMPDNSRRQRHVSLAVAHNIWQYHEVTGDVDFLLGWGAEMLVEIARYWVDLTTLDDRDGRYHIRGVMGPDEFHDGYPDRPGEGIDDNAYTNVMVAWLLGRAQEVVAILDARGEHEVWERLEIGAEEVADWDRMSRRLHVPFLPGGRIAQFEGYDELAALNWDAYRRRYGNIGRLDLILEAEGDSTNRYQLSKQADALMLFYLFSAEELVGLFDQLGLPFDPATIPATIDHYLARSSDGSTLSRVAHAWVLSRSDRARSWRLFQEALASDLDDIQGGTTREGIHLGAMAGTIDLVQRCYTGIEARDGVLWLNPRLPDELPSLELSVRYHQHRLDIEVSKEHLQVSSRPFVGAPVLIGLVHDVVELAPGGSVGCTLTPPG